MPISLAQSAITIVRPKAVIWKLLRRFFDCSRVVAQRQLFGAYGPLLSGKRSSECCGDGFCPISARKLANDCQRSQTAMPLPPYRKYPLSSGFWHRCLMPSHDLYSGVLRCVTRPDFLFLYFWQPQEVVLPDRRFPNGTIAVFPQSQMHSHGVRSAPTMRRFATRKPNLNPAILIGNVIANFITNKGQNHGR